MPDVLTLSRREWRLLWTLLDIWLRTDRQAEFSAADTKELVALSDRIARHLEPEHWLVTEARRLRDWHGEHGATL